MRLVHDVAYHIAKASGTETELIQATCLVHDLGNVLKKHDRQIINYPGQEKAVAIAASYGQHPNEATIGMLQSIQTDGSVVELVRQMEPTNWSSLIDSNNWLAKICAYADMRVAPTGIATLEERKDEVQKRTGKVHTEYYEVALEMQRQVLRRANMDPACIRRQHYARTLV